LTPATLQKITDIITAEIDNSCEKLTLLNIDSLFLSIFMGMIIGVIRQFCEPQSSPESG